ncbi:MAG TPA: S46 family peptidase [Caulobacterales bacterium]|nr:S46 family peptidase [Caulobacterales bacterium]
MVRFAGVIALVTLLAASASAEEGMWTFDNFPAARMRGELGWAPDQAWLDRVLAGSARIEGVCSAANVSAQGLVMTNHHCVRACIQDLSTPENNYYEAGFLARTGSEERRCTATAVQRLLAVRDVTREIDAATLNVPPEGFTRARDAAVARIESACKGDDAAKRCEVVALYQGGRYALHEYKRYEDVRLVFAPEAAIAHFGGDPDNFNFPRYAFDVAFIRLYENGAPAATPQHLRLRLTPLAEGEIALVSGNPGETSRLMTVDQLAFQRDFFMPWRLATLSELRGRLLAYAALGPNQARAAADQIQGVENTFKALNGRRLALVDASSFARVEAGEADLRARVQRNRAAIRDVGDAWSEIASAQRNYRTFFLAHQYLESRAGGGSRLFNWARDIVRGAAEREKPAGDRLARYAPARIGAVEHTLLAPRPVDAGIEELLLSFWAAKLREYLTVDDPLTQRVLGRESPEELAHRLISGTRLADPAERARLWNGGRAAVAASTDPMIEFVRAFDADARALQLRYQREIEGVVTPAQERIAQARFRAFGDSIYPDATFTARLSYGRVIGLTEPGGRVVDPFTRFEGLFARATGREPFALPARWSAAQSSLDPQTIFDVASSNDIIGGNSGSPLIDREGQVVGVVFDGNIYSLGGDYFYDGALNRTVSVSTTAIREALTRVYGADALVAELEAP